MTSVCPSRKELEELARLMLATFPARCKQGERERVRRAGKYWEARTGG